VHVLVTADNDKAYTYLSQAVASRFACLYIQSRNTYKSQSSSQEIRCLFRKPEVLLP